jgi:hypothetical protein
MKDEMRDIAREKQIDPRWQSTSEILYRNFSTKKMLLPMLTDFLSTSFFSPAIHTSLLSNNSIRLE